jgi:hypothetical protein
MEAEKLAVPEDFMQSMKDLNIATEEVNRTFKIAMNTHSKQLTELAHQARKWWTDLAAQLGFSISDEWELIHIDGKDYVVKKQSKSDTQTSSGITV